MILHTFTRSNNLIYKRHRDDQAAQAVHSFLLFQINGLAMFVACTSFVHARQVTIITVIDMSIKNSYGNGASEMLQIISDMLK